MKIIISLMFILLGISTAQVKMPIAVLDLDAVGLSEQQGSVLTDRLRTELFLTDVFSVLEREKMKDILTEQGFQLSGCTSNECAVEAGKLIGVQKMVAGKIAKFGKLYTLNIRLIDVETGKVIRTATDDCDCEIETVLTKSIKKVAFILSNSDNNISFKSELRKTITKKTKRVIITTNENNLYNSNDEYVSEKLMKYLNDLGYPIVSEDGFYNIDLTFNVKSGAQVYNLYGSFADLKITITTLMNGNIVYTKSFIGIKGIHVDYAKAKIEAIKNSWKKIEEILPEIVDYLK